MDKDRIIGATVFALCITIAISYIATMIYPRWIEIVGLKVAEDNIRFWLIATPVLIGFIAVLCIGAWIGWTMATTPPPRPIERLTGESQEDAEKTDG